MRFNLLLQVNFPIIRHTDWFYPREYYQNQLQIRGQNMSDEQNLDFLKEQASELLAILELMPGDTGTLNSLVFTYIQLGNINTAENYADKLQESLQRLGESETMVDYARQYLDSAPNSVFFQKLALGSVAEVDSFETPSNFENNFQPTDFSTGTEETDRSFFETNVGALDELAMQLTAELELADALKSKKVITDDQSDKAISSLIDNSSQTNISSPLTFLNELSMIDHVNIDKVLSLMSHQYSIPFIKVSQFDVDEELSKVFGYEISKKLGIVTFSMFKNEPLVAISNPIDTELKDTLSSTAGVKIHFYLTSPDEINNFYS